MCMVMRGVEKLNAKTVTSSMLGMGLMFYLSIFWKSLEIYLLK